jgi:hypothetical protein
LFDEVPVVALGEAHWVELQHSLIIELLLYARFAQIVDDIVVEFGNALHQPMVDRFLGGEDVAWADLRRAWQETVGGAGSGVFDSPVYDRFFRGVRMAATRWGPGPTACCSAIRHSTRDLTARGCTGRWGCAMPILRCWWNGSCSTGGAAPCYWPAAGISLASRICTRATSCSDWNGRAPLVRRCVAPLRVRRRRRAPRV